MAINNFDKMFWIRAGLGVAVGAASDLIFGSDYEGGILLAILVYIGTFYLFRGVWGAKIAPTDTRKLVTAGMPSFILLFLFFWILLFTLGVQY
jgi:hypothetical protein